jgi:hypothetical protein
MICTRSCSVGLGCFITVNTEVMKLSEAAS